MDSAAIEEVDGVIRLGRLKGSTRNSYSVKQRHFQEWLQQSYPECIDADGNIILTCIDVDIGEEYLSYVCLKKGPDDEMIIPVKFHYVGVIRSAIKALYKTEKVSVPQEVEDMFSEFMRGYKRKVESLRSRKEKLPKDTCC